MQPPPRKVKPSVSLKNIQTEQVSKLNIKHQQECDLLEDMRTFFSRKAALEKEYAQGLLKVTGQLLKREFPAQPDLSSQDGQEHKTVCAVWRTILEESDKLAKAKLQAAEVYSERVAEPLKPAKAAKVQCFKKVVPQLGVIHAEVAQCVMDLVKTQKAYLAEGGLAHEARQKSSEAEDKLKRKSTGIFQSLASLQKSCAKLRARTEASETKETATRNEYLLSLAAANAHQIRYYSTDLPDIMKTLDCDIYEKIQESLTLSGQVASEIADTEATFFHSIATEAAKICREFSQQCYLFQNPVFTNLVQYQFEPCVGETCNKLTSDHNAGPDLEKEARKWSTRVAKETRAIRDYYRQMTIVQGIKAGDKAADPGGQDSTVADPEAKLEELKQNIRKAEITKLKAEARLEALRLGGVNVDEWINQAQMESLVAEESGLTRTPSQASLRTESSGGQSANDDHEPTYTHYDDDDDFIDDTFSPASNRSGRVYPIVCKALYDFQASNYDEMTIKSGDDLELVQDGDGEGWVKAKNSLGQEGYIPETYVDLSGHSNKSPPLGVEAMNTINESISESVRPTANWQQQRQQPQTVVQSAPDLQSPTSADIQQDTASSYSSGDLEVQQTTEVMASGGRAVPSTVVTCTELSWARALYDYEAQTEEELSFLEGALIRILRKDDSGVDDGFWEGECNGCLGMFPSLVVEELGGPPDDPLSPSVMATQPDFSIPPPVHVTLPTPENEPPPPPSLENEEDSQSTPTPTADQSPKRVRFQQQGHGQHHHLHQHSHPHQQRHPQQKQGKSRQQRAAAEVPSDSDRGLSDRQLADHPTVTASPMLRHKSLPNSLDMPSPENRLVEEQQDSQAPQPSLCPCQFSKSQPQLSSSSSSPQRTPPPSRRLVLQRLRHNRQLQHYPSEPLMMNSDLEVSQTPVPHNMSLSLSDSSSSSGQHSANNHSKSYPTSPLDSPQTEDLASLIQVSFHPQNSRTHDRKSQHQPLLNYHLYQQTSPDVCQRHPQRQLSPAGTSDRSLTSDLHHNPSVVQSLPDNSQRLMSTHHQHEPPHHQHEPPHYQHEPPHYQHEPPHYQHEPPHHQHEPPHHSSPHHPSQPQNSHHFQVSSHQQPSYPPYCNAGMQQLPHHLNKSYHSQHQQQHRNLSPSHVHSHTLVRPASDKLSIYCRTHDDDWESEEGEESLV